MNLLLVAIFAASACLANGLRRSHSNLSVVRRRSHSNLSVEENYSGELKGQDDENDHLHAEQNHELNVETDSTSPNEIIAFQDKAKYWPQIVIIKPMALHPFGVGLLPNFNLYGQPDGPHIPGHPSKSIKVFRPVIPPTNPNILLHSTFTTSRPETHKPITTRPTTTTTPTTTTQAIQVTTAQVDEHESTTTTPDTEASCRTPNGGSGTCISVYSCQPLLDLVNKAVHTRTQEDIDLLKKSQCGFKGNAPAVCCPDKTEPPEPANRPCVTPEGNPGECVNLYKCPHLANMLKPPVPDANIVYVQNSRCQGPDQYSVCCGPSPDRAKDVTPGNCAARMSAFPLDPRTECCGVDSRVGNKIVGGNATTVDQYPWLVMIEYVDQGVTKLLCGGALISGKYVLTAAHCVAGHVLDVGTPRRVRLGEYDIAHEGPDCAIVEAGGEDCTDGVTRIGIERTIPHPQYNPVHPQKRHDIALIRLQETAPYTDFIRPICLPTIDLTQPHNIPSNFTLFAAGWGAVSTRQSYSNVKLHVDLPYVGHDVCQPAYSLPGRSVNLWRGQMCAGGINGKDSCKGDSGGPLMYEAGRTYEVIGVVSFGPVPCGMDGIPGVYSKVFEYLDWIRSVIVP